MGRLRNAALALLSGVSAENVEKKNGTINQAGSEMLQGLAGGTGTQSNGTVAFGTRPEPGTLPNAAAEPPSNPVRFSFPWSGNQVYTPRAGYGLTPFATLRNLARVSPEIFTCIQCRKDQMASLVFDFSPKDPKDKSPETQAQVKRARLFFAKPDKVNPFSTWVQTLVDEVLTIDALSIYRRKTRGGGLYAYEILDGATIKPLLDSLGHAPLPPDIAYRQIVRGAPMAGGDMTSEELIYAPKNVVTWSPYGCSPIEVLLLIITSAINRTVYNLSYYTEGNIPEALVGVPDSWNVQQVNEFTEYFNALLRGDPAARSRIKFVAGAVAKNVHEFKKPDFTTTWELWLLKVICACFGVTPSEIGFTDDVNKATSKTQGDVNVRRGIKPMANFIKGIMDMMLVEIGCEALETTYSGGEGEDALSQTQLQKEQISIGIKSLDEIRVANGDEPVGVGPCIVTASGAIPWSTVADGTGKVAVANPSGKPAVDGVTPEEQQVAQQTELKKYQTVATKAVKAGVAIPVFKSTILPAPFLTRLAAQLATKSSVEEVNKSFSIAREVLVEKRTGLSTKQEKKVRRIDKNVRAVLAAMGDDFAKHVEANV